MATTLILVHGGAGAYTDPDGARQAALLVAADAGYAELADGGDAVNAVVAAVRILEDDPHFDAGRGSVLNARGEVEMDAGVMRGSDRKFGAIAAVRGVAAPVTLARMVLDSDLVMMAGEGAVDFGVARGLERVDPALLVTPEALDSWMQWTQAGQPPDRGRGPRDTVGAVAVDETGRLAAATSTGGLEFTPPGRVGDSPLPGCGFWADPAAAASATGEGEKIARTLMTHRAVEAIAAGAAAQAAAERAVEALATQVNGVGGIIVAAADGTWGAAYNTRAMGHAWRTSSMSKPESAGIPDG